MIKAIANLITKWCERTGRRFLITGGDAKDEYDVYLVRYIVFKSKWCCLYIHRFLRSDGSDPHDHPWNFFTYVISGGYKEAFYDRNKPIAGTNEFISLWSKTINTRLPGSIAYRRATDIHQVILDRSYKLSEIEDAPLTVCLIGPRLREWGFWLLANKGKTWIDWRSYLNITPNDPRTKGSE